MKSQLLLGLAALASALGSVGATAQDAGPARVAGLADLSLEQLTKITVTSASRREETLVQAPASLFVITADDIRRSGAITIPEALRLAPNLHVARADANQYVISARGFSDVLANKLLVLIDGRTVYTPLFSGVFWEAQDTFLPDVDRIEVISGPGATLWGANAVNGVINIITKRSGDTQGGMARLGAGTHDGIAGLRIGAALPGGGTYRAHAKYATRESFESASGPIGDDFRQLSAGARADWLSGAQDFALLVDGYRGEVDAGPEREFSGASVVGRLVRRMGGESRLELQAYYDYTWRRHAQSFADRLRTFDVELHHFFRPREAHSVVWGAGYRHSRDDVTNSAAQAFIPEDRTLGWANAFVQDEIALGSGVSATLGLKVERNPFTGNEWLPNARIGWVRGDTLVWGALSRAVRAPSRIDREVNFPGTPPFLLTGSDVFESEIANVAELGYRAQASPSLSFSATAYYHDYPNLRSLGLVNGRPAFRNDFEGRVAGLEAWGTYRVSGAWRVSGGLVAQDIDTRVKPGRPDFGGTGILGNSPERMAQLRASWSPDAAIDLDVWIRHVGKLQRAVPAYSTADMRLAWRFARDLELSATVRNAFDAEHVEWQNQALVPRSFFLHLRWQS